MTSRVAPGGKRITYDHSPTGTLAKVTDYAGNGTEYQYDAAQRLSKVVFGGAEAATFAYDPAGNPATLTRGGITSSYTYDAVNRLTALRNQNGQGTVLSNYSYEYDKAGNVVAKTDAAGRTAYSYDALNRLASVLLPTAQSTQYTYDKVSNRTQQVVNSGTTVTATTSYTYDAASRLTQVTAGTQTATYTWDNRGNQLSDGNFTYSYDSLDRLVSAADGTNTVTYAYDGDSLVSRRTANGKSTLFYPDGHRVRNEGDDTGAITATMVQAGALNLARQVGADPLAYYVYNGHGDVTSLWGADGVQQARYDYDAFGALTSQTGTFDNPYLYAGEYYDYTLGLYNLRARFYSPGIGRFITRDTNLGQLNDPLSLNLYSYVKANPLLFVDPTGHVSLPLGEGSDSVVPDTDRYYRDYNVKNYWQGEAWALIPDKDGDPILRNREITAAYAGMFV